MLDYNRDTTKISYNLENFLNYLKKLLLQVRIKKDLSFVVINPLNSKIFNILFQNNPDTVYIYPVLSGKYLSDTPFHYPILLNHGNNTFLNYPQ